LDSVGHLRKLKIESEFEKVRELWKRVAAVRTAYHNLPRSGLRLTFPDAARQHKAEVDASVNFSKCLFELFDVWSGEMLSIPEDIADATEKLITIVRLEEYYSVQYPDPFEPGAMPAYDANARAAFFDQRAERLVQFVKGAKELEALMRKYLRGNVEDLAGSSPRKPS
jgi:hypothetical protein